MKTVDHNEMSITYNDDKLTHIKIVYGEYVSSRDMTVIFEDIIDKITNKLVSTELKGFYHGEPTIDGIETFYGELKAEYTL